MRATLEASRGSGECPLRARHARDEWPRLFRRPTTPDAKRPPLTLVGLLLSRYDDPDVKKFKLNVERNNGRAAMMGITGMMVHNALGVDALFPIVGGN